LISNALKFTQSGSVILRVRNLVQEAGLQKLEFSIKDTGKGIADTELNKLFQPFSQIKSGVSDPHKGSGLGLNISQQLVQSMGGKISVQSLVDIGSIFYFELDFGISLKKKLESTSTKIAKIDPEMAAKYPLDILLIEDDKFNQVFAIRLLKKMGYHIHCVENGQKALELLEQKEFEVLFMDVQMPVMDGLECTRRIRQTNLKQPYIIAMTANALEEDKEMCFKAGMDDFISKPINWVQLEGLIIKFYQQINHSKV
jgi:CheY-like chemotaxis protein